MATRRVFYLLPILALVLAGCYRQASDPVEPANETRLNTVAAPTAGGEDSDMDGVDAQFSLDDEIDAEPDADDAETDADESAPFELQLIESTPIDSVPPAPDSVPDSAAPTNSGPDSGEPLPTDDGQPTAIELELVTPGGPTGPSAISTPAPTNTIPAVELEPLVTPTDMFAPQTETVDPACVHVVRAGDTLFRIALTNDTTVEALRTANPQLTGDIIQPGDELTLPNCTPGDSQSEASPPTADPGLAAPIDTEPDGSSAAEVGAPVTHIVQPGETMGTIARQYGVTINAIAEANDISNPNVLSVGQELMIPSP